jgi:hypothetical protein
VNSLAPVRRWKLALALAIATCLMLAAHASASISWTNYSTSRIGRADSGGDPTHSFITLSSSFGVADAVECAVNRRRARISCAVRLASAGNTKLRWRLTRGRRTYRSGTANVTGGSAAIRLGRLRGLPRGRYLLHIDGIEQVTPIVIRRSK